MRISMLLVAVPLIGACYLQPAPPPLAYGPPPVYAGPPSYGAAPAGNLGGQWRVTEVVPPGQPFAGTYTTIWEMTDGGGQLWASGVWSNGGPRSRYAGAVRGQVVHFDRTDENGFRGAFDGSISPDGNVMSGVGRNDPTSPGGNAAEYTWTAERIFAGTATTAPPSPAPPPAPPLAATGSLTGRWQVTETVPRGQPFAGTYTGTWDLIDSDGQLSGDGVWSIGPRGRYAGWRRGATVHLDRTDESGFRGSFEGSVGPHGATMRGVGRNDPASPGGNSASYSWTARRM